MQQEQKNILKACLVFCFGGNSLCNSSRSISFPRIDSCKAF